MEINERKSAVLLTVWHTIWMHSKKKLYLEYLQEFAGDDMLDVMTYIRTKAEKQGYQVKYGRKYVSLEKE